jgi:hypothetical protein
MKGKKKDRFFRVFMGLVYAAMIAAFVCIVLFGASGCRSYKGGQVTDGTNLAIGMKLPGTEWTLNLLDYVGGIRVGGNDQTYMCVTNEVWETNTYFAVISTTRHTKMSASIAPTVEEGGEESAKAN